jgi:serine-type D-Ala-D-Ala carboxypeptidase (penicillin-binding protein 5/6)
MRPAAKFIAYLALVAAASPLADATDAPAAPPVTAQAAPVPPPPAITAKSYVLIDALSRQVLAGQNETARVDPASLTKLMTSYAVFAALRDGKLRLDQEVPVSEHAWRAGGAVTDGSTSFLELNSRVKVDDLLQGMIVQSGNDATIALAEAIAGSESTFAALMNQYSDRLGLKGSHWNNSAGVPDPDPTHYTTALDVALLSAALASDFPQYYHYFSQKSFTFNGHKQDNRNRLLLKDPTIDGLKTGHTQEAGYCLAASALRNGTRFVAVVMGTDSFAAREDATAALLGYGFNFFETRKLYSAAQVVGKAHVWKASDMADVVVHQDVAATLPRGLADTATATVSLEKRLIAPIAATRSIGTLRVMQGDKLLAEVPVYPARDVPTGGFLRRLIDTIRLWFV